MVLLGLGTTIGLGTTMMSSAAEPLADISFVVDAAFYAPDAPAPGLVFSDDDVTFAPRLSMFVDAPLGSRATVRALARANKGFDPGSEPNVEVRFDEYFVEVHVLDASRLDVRVGKFRTAFGSWVRRHLAWENPLITAPALYEDVLPMTDQAAPADPAAFVARRNSQDKQPDWVPIVWGPSYATGAALSGATDTLRLDVEVKNTAVSSRPETWDALTDGFDTDPTVTGRLEWRPAPEWSFGSSASLGPYMQDDAEPTLPDGDSVDDFDQTTFGLDAAYEHHRLQVFSELALAEFEVPRVGDVEVLSGFVEAKYKVTPQLWAAGRWNQSWFDDAPGLDVPWDRDTRRLDLALGFHHGEHVATKLQWSVGDQAGRDTDGDHLLAAQVVAWF